MSSVPLIGRAPDRSVLHFLRRPHWNEGRPEERGDPEWFMSLCSLVWRVVDIDIGKATCKRCIAIVEKNRRELEMRPKPPTCRRCKTGKSPGTVWWYTYNTEKPEDCLCMKCSGWEPSPM